jgi:hypothetical protein
MPHAILGKEHHSPGKYPKKKIGKNSRVYIIHSGLRYMANK